jgi:hypothetical protein
MSANRDRAWRRAQRRRITRARRRYLDVVVRSDWAVPDGRFAKRNPGVCCAWCDGNGARLYPSRQWLGDLDADGLPAMPAFGVPCSRRAADLRAR